MKAVEFRPLRGIPQVHAGDDLAALLGDAADRDVRAGDILVVTHKIVSKAEGRVVRLDSVTPSSMAAAFAAEWGRDARQVEIVLRESRRVVRMARGMIISETRHGFVCANAGVDLSNAGGLELAVLLPEDPDASARLLREKLSRRLGFDLPVIITDSFGRPWRSGIVNVAIGVAGMEPVTDYRGVRDPHGYELSASVMGTADAIAAAAELVMGKTGGVPAAVARGIDFHGGEGGAAALVLEPEKNLFP
ncbi:MAG: coenzyme F420-0:L-glutamate ligase [Armatimonadetes bacterium]|nr:coenzyme F420-0:L-glutamate ligase [Armatimonadota bacterium]